MKVLQPIFISALLVVAGNVSAQLTRIEEVIDPMEAESHLRFLTSDELKGRNTGSEELVIAARYISEQFRRFGVHPLGDNEEDYLQAVPLVSATPATAATAKMIGEEFSLNQNLLVASGNNTELTAALVYLEDLMDFKQQDVAGKVIVTVLGDYAFRPPLKDLEASGAVGIIQLYRPGWRYPWP